VIYALPKQYHPDFSNPRLKPRLGIKLNPNHSLRRGLLLDLEMSQGAGQAFDSVSKRPLTNISHPAGKL